MADTEPHDTYPVPLDVSDEYRRGHLDGWSTGFRDGRQSAQLRYEWRARTLDGHGFVTGNSMDERIAAARKLGWRLERRALPGEWEVVEP